MSASPAALLEDPRSTRLDECPMDTSGPLKPTFLYIGAAKAGTFWLYEILREHPEVFVPVAGDVMFFDRLYDRGLDFYWSYFRKAAGFKAIGDISHDYFLSAERARRIHDVLPDAKLICCLREGIDRTMSEYLYDKTVFQYVRASQHRRGFSFEEFARLPVVVRLADYYNCLLPFYELFPAENILVLFFDELKQDAADFVSRIYRFIGVDPGFVPPSLHRRINVARTPRSGLLADLAFRTAQVLRRRGLGNLVGRVKHNSAFARLLYRPYKADNKPAIPPLVRERLREIYHKDYSKLAALIGRPLPDQWCAGTCCSGRMKSS